MENRQPKIRSLALAGMFAALITIFIWFVKIPIPSTQGYVHLGDALIYLTAYLLPTPYAAAAAALGGLVADLCVGAAVYAFPTAVIKAGMALVASFFLRKIKRLPLAMALGFGLGALVLVGGYFFFEMTVWGSAYAVVGLLWNTIQGVASGLLATPMVLACRQLHDSVMKKRGDRARSRTQARPPR